MRENSFRFLLRRRRYFVLLLTISIFIIFFGCRKESEKASGLEKEKEKQPAVSEIIEVKAGPKDKRARELKITTVPQDGGFVRRADQSIYVYLSQPVEKADFSFDIYPEVEGWKTEWARGGRVVILKHESLFQIGQVYDLTLTIASFKLKKQVKFRVYGPSSLELINRDEAEARIDFDQAWLFRLQALFEPSRLPERYRSQTPLVCGTRVMAKFKQIKARLKPQTIQRLRSYLVPPTHPESVFSRLQNSETASPAGFSLFPQLSAQSRGRKIWGEPLVCKSAPLKIWYKKDDKKVAEEARRYLDSENMYSRFQSLMGQEPPSDSGERDNGGDGYLDFYLVRLGDNGQCVSYQDTPVSPSYILINRTLRGGKLLATLAHELFHSFQFAFDQFEDEWWVEGTATWAEDFIDQNHNDEQQFIPDAFFFEENRLETINSDEGFHPYGIYLFPLYLDKFYEEGLIGDVWQACASLQSLSAVENVVQDWKELLKDFAYKCLDIGPTEALYPDAGGPLQLFVHHWAKEVVLKSDKTNYEIEFNLPPLSATYFLIQNRCDAKITPHIEFDLRGIKAFNWITVQVIIDPEGEAQEEDWTGREKRSFCVNKEEEKFDEIALVVASSDKNNPVRTSLRINVDAKGCLQADATLDWTIEIDRRDKHQDEYGSRNNRAEIRAVARAQLKLQETYVDDEEISAHYDVLSWGITSVTGTAQIDTESHPSPGSKGGCVTRCQGSGSVVRWKKEDAPRDLSITYEKKSGRVKSVVLSPAAAIIYWQGSTECEHICPDRSWTTTEPWVPDWEYFPLLHWGAFKETAESARGNIKSSTITGGGTYQFVPPQSPESTTTLKASYTLKIKRKKNN
jgi:hypothetical protein